MDKVALQRIVRQALHTSPVQRHVQRILLFGSYAKGTQRSTSDIDLLLELKTPVSLLKVVQLERHLSAALGKNVDLCTPKSISKYFHDEVLQSAEPLYESAA